MPGRECYHCKQWIEEGEEHDCYTTEAALTQDLSDDLRDAWERLLVSGTSVVVSLSGRLRQPFPSLRHKLQRLYHHAFAAASRQFLPPLDSFLLICFVGEIYDSQSRKQQIGISVGILASISICHMWSFHVCMPDSLASKWKGASFKSAKEWTGQQYRRYASR
jgi:hypothetical protein